MVNNVYCMSVKSSTDWPGALICRIVEFTAPCGFCASQMYSPLFSWATVKESTREEPTSSTIPSFFMNHLWAAGGLALLWQVRVKLLPSQTEPVREICVSLGGSVGQNEKKRCVFSERPKKEKSCKLCWVKISHSTLRMTVLWLSRGLSSLSRRWVETQFTFSSWWRSDGMKFKMLWTLCVPSAFSCVHCVMLPPNAGSHVTFGVALGQGAGTVQVRFPTSPSLSTGTITRGSAKESVRIWRGEGVMVLICRN